MGNLRKSELGWLFMNSGWMLPNEAFDWIENNIPPQSMILEFGSGDGSNLLLEKYSLFSVEHDPEWLEHTDSNYIYAPITANNTSTLNNEIGWYDRKYLSDLPNQINLLIIDGPTGEIGRSGIIDCLDLIVRPDYILVDDTDREKEYSLSKKLCEYYMAEVSHHTSSQKRANGEFRKFDILIPKVIDDD